jgi:SagB-type dehydrogenase family enzyme
MNEKAEKQVLEYHERTKHHYERYARSPGYMDWKNQPNPFRFYEGIGRVLLPFLREDPKARHLDLYRRDHNPAAPFSLQNIAAFLELSMALSAWKSVSGAKWALRINPSSGNLHPSEAYVVLPPREGLKGSVCHYSPFDHALEPTVRIPAELWNRLEEHFGSPAFLVGLTSIFWRESWKYGERAFRYCNHDAGHALACLSISANLQGWKVTYLNALSDEATEGILGLGRTLWEPLEQEHPDFLCVVRPSDVNDEPRSLNPEIISAFAGLMPSGAPNRLSESHVQWDIIYETAAAAAKPPTAERRTPFEGRAFFDPFGVEMGAARIIRQRRSGVAYDTRGSFEAKAFFSILDKTLPRVHCAPFDADLGEPSVHLLLFVHRVDGLERGLYFLLRSVRDLHELKAGCARDLLWERVEEGFPLYLLMKGDFSRQAAMVSCHQEIAGEGAFSLGMVGRFKEIVEREPYRYRHLHWEAGMIGQVLYLEAEAHGQRGTGIGCFFDDPVCGLMGIRDNRFQSVYHFAVGTPIEDGRLTTLPPYHHLDPR